MKSHPGPGSFSPPETFVSALREMIQKTSFFRPLVMAGLLTVGDKFTLFSQPLNNGGSLAIVPPPGVILANNLAMDGSITVLAAAGSAAMDPTNITFSTGGGAMGLSWPADHLGWTLQSNSLSLANAGDWFDLPDSQNNTGLVIALNPATAHIFYRLRHPQVASYPLPSCYAASSQLTLVAGGVNVPVIDCSIPFVNYDYCNFSCSGSVTISIVAAQAITNYSISPIRSGIAGVIHGNTLTFTLASPQYLIVKINNLRNLVIAADALETNVPPASGPGIYNVALPPYNADSTGVNLATIGIQNAINAASAAGGGVVYVPAGVYRSGNLILKSNVSLYLAGGSVIRGTGNPADYATTFDKVGVGPGTWFIYTTFGAANMKIYGRGTIDGNGHYMSNSNGYYNDLVVPIACTNFILDGVILRDSSLWGLTPIRSANITIQNTKHFNNNDLDYQDDAMDIEESRNVTVTHAVAVSEDDTYSVKTWDKYIDLATNWPGSPEIATNIVFNDCLAWSRCGAFKIGQGIYEPISGVTFENSVVFRCMYAVTFIHKTDSLSGVEEANGITYSNIDVEGFWPRNGVLGRWLDLELDITGPVTNMVVAGVNVLAADQTPSILTGYTAYSSFSNIQFVNDHYLGAVGTNLLSLNITATNSYLGNITFQ
jgi:hypothetical protein